MNLLTPEEELWLKWKLKMFFEILNVYKFILILLFQQKWRSMTCTWNRDFRLSVYPGENILFICLISQKHFSPLSFNFVSSWKVLLLFFTPEISTDILSDPMPNYFHLSIPLCNFFFNFPIALLYIISLFSFSLHLKLIVTLHSS